ncbi:Nicotinate-nucleotide diphosphorylase [Colletotrichum asianum]
MSNQPYSDLKDVWRLGNEPGIRCCAYLQMISGEAMVRTFRVLPPGKEQQHETRSLRTPDDYELILHDRHLSCLLKRNDQYATVSHVWHEGISEIQNQEYLGLDSPDLQRLVFRIPTEIAHSISKALGQDIEWSLTLKTSILEVVHKIYASSTLTVVHLDDVTPTMVNKFLHATEDTARLEGMIGICNSKWYSRVWTAMEYIRSAKVRVMNSEKQLHGEDSAQLYQPQLNQFWGEQTAKNGCHDLEAQLEIGKNIMPWNLGSLDLCRADSKSRNFGLAFALLSRRGCRDKYDFLYALQGIITGYSTTKLSGCDWDEMYLNLAYLCLREGDYTPLLVTPEFGPDDGLDVRNMPANDVNEGYNDVYGSTYAFPLGHITSPPEYHDALRIADNGDVLIKMQRARSVYQSELWDGNFDHLAHFCAHNLVTPNVDDFAEAFGARLFFESKENMMQALSTGDRRQKLEQTILALSEVPLGQPWPQESPYDIFDILDALGILGTWPEREESRYDFQGRHGNILHLTWRRFRVWVKCAACGAASVNDAGLFIENDCEQVHGMTITDKLEIMNEINPVSNDNRRDAKPDYPELTRLMIQYMKEAIASGEVFMNSADHVGNGWRLFSWAHGATEAIEAMRTGSISNTTVTSAWEYLSDDASLKSIIVDEHPFILGTIFAIWKSATLVGNGDEMGKMFLGAVLKNCEKLLAPGHFITDIFKCLTNGRFDPDYCIDRLAVLPSEVFSRGTQALNPRFEFGETSDYQTIKSLPNRQYLPVLSNAGLLQLKSSLGHDDTSGFTDDFDTTPIRTISNAGLPFDARSQYQGHVDSSVLGPSASIPSSSMMRCETEQTMLLQEQSPSSTQGSLLGSISTCSSPEPQTLESEKKRIVDNIMREFLENLDTFLEEVYEDKENGGGSDGCDQRDDQSENKGKGVSRSTDCRKRNRSGKYVQRSGGRGGNDAGDGDNQRGGGNSKKPKLDPEGGMPSRLACPYFKWNPRKYRHHRVCVSPGWESVHRVKEHLYRCHQKPKYQCLRCYQDLEGEAALGAHLRTTPLCEAVSLPEPCDKFGTEIESLLRKRSSGKMSEKDQWIGVYKILFDVLDDELPTPYCEDFNLAYQSESWSEHVQREVRPLLRELLATEVAQAITNIAPEILHNLRDLVRQLEPTLRRSYERSQEQDRDQDDGQNQPEEREVDEEEDDERETNPSAGYLHLTPIPHSSSNTPHASTSAPVTHDLTINTSAHIPYSSSSIPNTLSSDPFNFTSVGYREDYEVDAFGQTFSPSMATWASDFSATTRPQPGSLSVPTGWSVVGGDFTFNDTNIGWDNWQNDFGGGYEASPGGGGPSGGT